MILPITIIAGRVQGDNACLSTCEKNGLVGSAKTNTPDINEMAAVDGAAAVRANTRHFDELPLAMRHTRI